MTYTDELLLRLEELQMALERLDREELMPERVRAMDLLLVIKLLAALPTLYVEKGKSITVTLTTYQGPQGNP